MALSKDGSPPPPPTPPDPIRRTSPRPDHASSSTEEDRTEVLRRNNPTIYSHAPTDGRDQNDYVISIKGRVDKVSKLDKEVWSRYSIFRAPRNLRKMEPEAYAPQFISIGPIHRGADHLQLMESHKWRFLRRSLDRTGKDLDVYINAISPLVAKTRGCYALRTDHMDDQKFVEMMLLDSCFILELLIAVAQGIDRDEPLFAVRAVVLRIRRDMLLLENQIPLFVLNELFPIIAGSDLQDFSVSQLALFFFNTTVPGNIYRRETSNTGNEDEEGRETSNTGNEDEEGRETSNTGNEDEEGLHLLQVIRQKLVKSPSFWSLSSTSSHILDDNYRPPHLMMRCVSTLVDSGVIFEKSELKKNCKLTDIEFKEGVLKIPLLLVDDATKSIFLNLMAFEQCYPHCSDQISAYVVFMDGLINTPRDVAYLQQKGIIHHQLGSEEAVSKLFNDLCREISIDHKDGSYLFKLSYDLDLHVSRRCPTWRASLRREYFRHPWSTLSVIAAILIIGIGLTQTVYAILAYHVYHS